MLHFVAMSATGAVIAKGIETGVEVYEILKKRGVLERLVNVFWEKPANNVFIFGNSGTGKTSFRNALEGLSPAINRQDRTTHASIASGTLAQHIFHFHDTPGGDQDKDKRLDLILRGESLKPLGIINVVSYGYHEGSEIPASVLNNDLPRPAFLADRRLKEIGRLDEWTPLFGGRDTPVAWMMTVVTKADLWWSPVDGPPIMDHYRNGDYYKALGGMTTLSNDVRRYSALDQLFFDRAPMSGYYTTADRRRDTIELIESLCRLALDAHNV